MKKQSTEKKLKPKYKFPSTASYHLSRGATKEDILEISKDFEGVTSPYVEDYLKNKFKNDAVIGAIQMGREEKEKQYSLLDNKFITSYPNLVIFSRGESSQFYEYVNGVYKLLYERDMYNYIDELMRKEGLLEHRTSKRKVEDTMSRIASLLSGIKGRHYSEDELLHKKWYLNLKNGLLDMETFHLSPHTPDYFSTVQVPYEYDPSAKCPEFDKFIETVSVKNSDTAMMIKQMFGYSIMDGNPMHKVFYLYGDTARNGKSTCAKILCGLIGVGNVSTLTLNQIANENSSIMTSIVGKQINFSDEISSKFIESSRLTAMAAEGVVEINPKYKPAFLYTVKAKFIIACNDLPRFIEYQGMKHRMISIPFHHHFKESERINRYDQVLLEKEGPGILNWAIEGAKTIKNGFVINDDSKEDLHDNLLQSSPVYAYMEMTYDFSPDYTDEMSAKELYGELGSKDAPATGFRLFCEENGIKATSSFTFERELKRFAGETNNIKQIRVGHRRDRKYIGMKLQSANDGDRELDDMVNSIKI
jgi:putative DNA primase/helicase